MNTVAYTTIQLSSKDAMEFVKFQKHYALVELLDSLGAFEIKNGSVEIHFDSMGQIGSVDVHRHFRPKNGII